MTGAAIESVGLRHLPGVFLFQIERGGAVIAAPPPGTRLTEGGRLAFTGVLESDVDLQRIRGLTPTQRQDSRSVAEPAKRELVGAVEPVVGCIYAALLKILCRCLTVAKVLSRISLPVVVSIGTALGMGVALEQTGTAVVIASRTRNASQEIGVGELAMLFAMIVTATACSRVLAKNGAAALSSPAAMVTTNSLGGHLRPFAFSLIGACGLSAISPVAYQTKLMVHGAGGCRFLAFPTSGGRCLSSGRALHADLPARFLVPV